METTRDIGQLASLARTALDDPGGLPEPDQSRLRSLEGKAVLTSDDPFVLYAIDRLDDIISITDPDDDDRATIVHPTALLVKDDAIKVLREREREFKRDMLRGANFEVANDVSLDDVQAMYDEHYDDIWLSDDGLAADNERHEADDYYEGFEAGAAMVLEHLHVRFGIEPPTDATEKG